MPSRVTLLALACVIVCAALVAWKVSLGYQLNPRASEDRWSVQLTAQAKATGERARLHLALPGGDVLDHLYDQRFKSNGVELSGVRVRGPARIATFSSGTSQPSGTVTASYRFSARAPPRESTHPAGAPRPEDSSPTPNIPSDDPLIVAKARELTPTAGDDTAKVRGLYDFVLDEVGPSGAASTTEDASALEALANLQGTPTARVRLFVALVRSLGIPSRVVRAVPLIEGINRPLLVRAEVFLENAWVAVDPVNGRFGPDAEEGFVLLRGGEAGTLLRTEGLETARFGVSVTREGLNEFELYRRRMAGDPTIADRISMYGLPPRAQLIFRVLLLVPLGALIVSLFRNLVGTPTFGTFMPILIALALRESNPLTGIAVLGIVVATGILARRWLQRLRLLVVPRLSLLLTIVICIVGAVAVASANLLGDEGLGAALLPMVIMTMTIERLGVLIEEEGIRSALKTTGGTLLVAMTGYLVLQSDALQRVVFTFPELNLLVIAALLMVGRYTGYRLTEALRFRSLATEKAPEARRAA